MKNRALMLAALLCSAAVHAEPALTIRSTDLQAQSQSDAETLATLPENTKVDVLRRRGAWSEVKTAAGQTGWVRMMALKFGDGADASAAKPAQGNPLGALDNLLSSGRTSNTATVTTGVRGLSEEDLQNAQANPAELQKLQEYAADGATAQAFALHSELTPVQVDYLPEPSIKRHNEQRSGEL